MMALIDKLSILAEQIEDDFENMEFERGREKAKEMLILVGQLDDYELAQELEDLAWKYLQQH